MSAAASATGEDAGASAAGGIAVIGEEALAEGFRLAGASVHACRSSPEILRAWRSLPRDTAVVVLTPRAAQALGPALADTRSPMTVVLPS